MDQENNEIQSSKSISIMDIILNIRKFWIACIAIVIGCTLLATIAAAVLANPKYTASASIMVQYVPTQNENETINTYRNATALGSDLLGTIQDLSKSRKVLDAVKLSKNEKAASDIEALREEAKYINDKYGKNIKITLNEGSVVLFVSYTTTLGEKYAVDTVNQVADSIISVANTVDDPTKPVEEQKPVYKLLNNSLVILDYAQVPSVSDSFVLYVIIGFAVGIVAAIIFAVVMSLLDDTVKSKNMLENITGFKAIAFIEDVDSQKPDKPKKRSANH